VHESSLIPDLIEKITALAAANGSRRVTAVVVTIGALTGMDADHLREHFDSAAAGTVAQDAELRCRVSEDPLSSAIILESLELEQEAL
jgi:hydrogenase nickel incorporation protein HypA/HybF